MNIVKKIVIFLTIASLSALVCIACVGCSDEPTTTTGTINTVEVDADDAEEVDSASIEEDSVELEEDTAENASLLNEVVEYLESIESEETGAKIDTSDLNPETIGWYQKIMDDNANSETGVPTALEKFLELRESQTNEPESEEPIDLSSVVDSSWYQIQQFHDASTKR